LTSAPASTISRTHRGGSGVFDFRSTRSRTPLLHACSDGHTECAELLVASGASVGDADESGMTALMLACQGQNWPCARMLLEAGEAGPFYSRALVARAQWWCLVLW
jgi:ankyrin repeat protein